MFRYHALGSASLLVLCCTLIPSTSYAQTASQNLPPVTVDAPRPTVARPAARKPGARSSARTQVRPPSANATTAVSQAAPVTPGSAVANLYQAPAGQTQTTVDRSQFDNRPSFSVSDVLRD